MLNNKIAFVTGSSRGIGKAIAIELAKNRANVVITYNKNLIAAQKVRSEIVSKGGKAIICKLDVTSRKSIKKAFNTTKKHFGRIDILINNAGIHHKKDFLKINDQEWDKILNANLKGPFMSIQEILPEMLKRKEGKIINISSIGGQKGGIYSVHYAAAKAGLINLTRSMARMYSDKNIYTYCIAPGLVKTDMARNVDFSKELKNIPAKRIADPSEIAKGVVFLCSDGANYLTGQTFNYNGGEYFGS